MFRKAFGPLSQTQPLVLLLPEARGRPTLTEKDGKMVPAAALVLTESQYHYPPLSKYSYECVKTRNQDNVRGKL